jgi:methylglutaconyl-CoA hydratase
MVEELTTFVKQTNDNPEIRIICLRGKGVSFSAGADLVWMQKATDLTREDNFAESVSLSRCYHAFYSSPKITIAGVHGAAMGGAIGLITACDLALATESSIFAFPEVNMGLIPAVISPYVFHKANKGKVMEYLLTGRKFRGLEAESLGLVTRCVPDADLDQAFDDLLAELLCAAPLAQFGTKNLARSLVGNIPDNFILEFTPSLLAETRVSDEAKEGIRAFLEKRNPGWNKP